MDLDKEKKMWSARKRVKSFTHAFRGIKIFLATTPNAWIHIFSAFIAVVLGFYFRILPYEWLALVLTIGLVFISESFNTAVEIDINLTSPDYHPYARDTKDVAAGAVLISVVVALVTGLIIFIPRIF